MTATEQWNLRVPPEFNDQVRAVAGQQRKSLTRYVLDAVQAELDKGRPAPERIAAKPAVATPKAAAQTTVQPVARVEPKNKDGDEVEVFIDGDYRLVRFNAFGLGFWTDPDGEIRAYRPAKSA